MCCLCMDIKGAFLLLYLMDSSVIVVISVINFSQQLWSSCRCINNHEIVKYIPIFEVTLFVQDECCMVIRSSWSYLPKNKFMITNLVVNSVILISFDFYVFKIWSVNLLPNTYGWDPWLLQQQNYGTVQWNLNITLNLGMIQIVRNPCTLYTYEAFIW